MTSVLLDTDVFSYFFERESRAALYAPVARTKAAKLGKSRVLLIYGRARPQSIGLLTDTAVFAISISACPASRAFATLRAYKQILDRGDQGWLYSS